MKDLHLTYKRHGCNYRVMRTVHANETAVIDTKDETVIMFVNLDEAESYIEEAMTAQAVRELADEGVMREDDEQTLVIQELIRGKKQQPSIKDRYKIVKDAGHVE